MRTPGMWIWLVCGCCAAVLGYVAWNSAKNVPSGKDSPDLQAAAPSENNNPKSDRVVIGGIERPKTDVRLDKPSSSDSLTPPKRPQGFAAPVPSDANEQVAQVAAALKEKSNPARYSSFVVPVSFDAQAFAESPKQYADLYSKDIEPGRVFATAQPGESVVPLRATSSRFHRVKQGESVRLAVKAVPNAPVTFSSQDLGTFDNKLTSITVVADDQGSASATFTAGGGTIDETQILAGSPVNSGQVAFTVAVKVPQ